MIRKKMYEEMSSSVPTNSTGLSIAGTGDKTNDNSNLVTWSNKKKKFLPLRKIIKRK